MYEEGKAKGTIGWDVVTLIPPLVFGHYLGEVTPEKMNFSVGVWYRHVLQELPPVFPALDAYVDVSFSGMTLLTARDSVHRPWTDVRDFVAAARLSLTTPRAGGERFVIANGNGASVWGQWGQSTCTLNVGMYD